MSSNIEKVLKAIIKRKKVKTSDVVKMLGVSRQYASRILKNLVTEGKLTKLGSIRNARYTLPQYADKRGGHQKKQILQNKNLEEDKIMKSFLLPTLTFRQASEDVQNILQYAFSEMLNNAIEHSQSRMIAVELYDNGNDITFIVKDLGMGVFRNIMQQRHLQSEFEAMQDILKGKTTTAPQAHSGEGIFFTSKAADRFTLESFDHRMIIDNTIPDIFFEKKKPAKRGTRVLFSIAKKTKRRLNDIFESFQSDSEERAFDKTEIHVRLFTMGTIYISRSQARRIVTGLEKFKLVILDFDRVLSVGQAFADEIFRVFKNQHPEVTITPTNMNEAVRFMIERVAKT